MNTQSELSLILTFLSRRFEKIENGWIWY